MTQQKLIGASLVSIARPHVAHGVQGTALHVEQTAVIEVGGVARKSTSYPLPRAPDCSSGLFGDLQQN